MSRVVKTSPCPRCRERGKDSRGDNLVTYDDGGSHCFSCAYHEHPKHFVPKIKEIYVSKVLPPDFTREVPTVGWKWLLQYGLSYNYWKETVGFSPKEGRLYFTVGPKNDPVFSIGRLVEEVGGEGKRPKWKVWGDCHKHADLLPGRALALAGCTVLVEDIVSAHKVAEAGAEAMALFGTQVHPCHVYALRRASEGLPEPIVMWLDKDQEGAVGKKATRLHLLTNRPVYILHTNQDPKCLSLETIKETLNETLRST
jgi:hypothetical protein